MAESQNIEYKESWRDEYLKWICGFANAQGGKIYIGRKDDGTVIGVKNAKKLLEDIPNKIQNKLGIVADVNRLEKEGLDKESFDIFRREALRSGRMTKEDLDISNEELLDKLDLLTDGKLKRAGALCFYRQAEKIISGCYVKIGKFEGSELLYQDEVHGSLLLMADRIIDLIYLKYLKAAVSYHKETRVETYPFAREAIREAVYNALIHCNWADDNPIQIRIEEEVMYISNSSMLPFGWTAETLLEAHSSRPFNPDIARVFYRAGYIESWGRGIQKICDACKNLGTDAPEYIVHGEDIMVKFAALQSAKISDSKTPKRQIGVLNDVLAERILMELREYPAITQRELAAKLQVPYRSLQRQMDELKRKGSIKRVGSKRYGHWEA